jgi:hypothetical protein
MDDVGGRNEAAARVYRFTCFRQWRRTVGGKDSIGRQLQLLYSELALSRKPFRIGNMYIYTCLLRMAVKTHMIVRGRGSHML